MSVSGIRGLRTKGLPSSFWSLLTMQFKVEYGQRGMAEKLGLGRKSRQAWLYLGLMVMAFVPLMGFLYQMGDSIAAQSVAIAQPGLPVIVAVMMGQFLVFFIGISALMSTLYYATDLEMLQAMPLTGRQILGAKVLIAYVAQLIFSSVIAIPFLVPLGLRLGSPLFWVLAALVNLVIPAIPLALALLFTILIMRGTKGFRHRDMFRVVFGLAFFLVIMAFQFFNSSMVTKGPEEIMRALTQPNGLVQMAAGYYPPLKWAAWALTGWATGTGLIGTVAFLGGSVAALLAVATVAQGWFLGGLGKDVRTAGSGRTAGTVGTHSRRHNAASEGSGSVSGLFSHPRDPSVAVTFRDHWVLTRTPNFLLVVLTNLAIIPIMWVFGAVGGGELRMLIGGFAGASIDALVLIMIAAQGGLASMNQVSSTSISREGGTFWLSKMIPVPARTQVRGKLRYSMLVAAVQLATLLVSAAMLFRVDLYHLAVVAVLGLLVSWPVSAICLINDLYSPRLSWTEPHQAMKGNFATLGAMLLSAVYLFVGGFVVRMIYKAGLGGVPLYLVVAAIAAASGFALQKYMENLAGPRYEAIEA